MTVKDACERLGINSKELFHKAYKRYGILYSIGGPEVTHAEWERHGTIPIYVARFIKFAPEKKGEIVH